MKTTVFGYCLEEMINNSIAEENKVSRQKSWAKAHLCTWPIEPTPIGTGSHSENI